MQLQFHQDTCPCLLRLVNQTNVQEQTQEIKLPEGMPDIRRMKVLRPGLELGTLKKDRFEPAHALALWLTDCRRAVTLDPDGPETKAYMHGETLPGTQKGWTLIKCGPFPMGWAKGDGNQLKNHYPKGLRR